MEASVARWFPDMGMEDPSFFHQWDTNSLDQVTAQQLAVALGQDFQQSLSSESYTSYPPFQPPGSTTSNTFSCSSMDTRCAERPKKVLKASSWNSCTTEQNPAPAITDASSPSILSFGNLDSPRNQSDLYERLVGAVRPKEEMEILIPHGSKRSYENMVGQGPKRMNMGARPSSHNQDHIIAERKRREKLSQRFIALSAIIPGLKKMDKASVLGDAIKYLKQLQEKVKSLEEQNTKRTVESAVLVKKSQLSSDDVGSCDENFDGHPSGESLPEIEAKMSEKSVLIKIHCEKSKGILVEALSEIEKLHLTVINASVIPFASSSLDITVVAQVEEEFSMTLKDLVKKLNSAFRQFV
ncbi:transcription factor bHLH18-like [Phoenix dactylifera]|uniref:Transcription factor bHLH18-like n=1 Tax=Phoenix dactylifera TaxID=42345 RepID=A0A8B8ZYW6_PHODC|nr:transcription factor bHLH18-like [Phoenix dactylifera]XP_038978561.1 transcription factor bHLH18-like [Phoenix dactylifera]XP_038978562.1 transcription factor bHLH18-like [Phoenix dactylifera]XP_038978563.1 transcription factor bHLH18-like [Phoenix dactylifera]